MHIQRLSGMLQSKIKTVYEKHSGSRVCQGDIYRDFSFSIVTENAQVMEISFPYIWFYLKIVI